MKKKIDLIYRDTFRNLETTPPDDVWEHIAASLPEEQEKRRIVPFWYKAAGIAAVIALLIAIFQYPFQNTEVYGTISVSPGEINYSLDLFPVSEDFKQSFLKASIGLEAAMINSRNLASQNGSYSRTATVKNGSATNSAPVAAQENVIESVLNDTFLNETKEPSTSIAGMEEKITTEKDLTAKNLSLKEAEKALVAASGPEKDLPVNKTAIAETEDRSSLSRRFSITPTAGAVYYDNLGSGSAIDAQFSNNRGSGEVSMAYGINLAYQVSEKIKIRTGISKVNLSHNTQDVSFASAVNSNAVETSLLSIASAGTGSLNQNLGFIEIPVEMEYSLINKKVGLSIIGGASTLLLDENRISLNTFNTSTDLGEARNLNEVSFSTNIGLGVNYNISPQFRLNVEPMFKYQLNTFNNTSGFNPYIFGIYSGFSYRF